MDEPKKLAEARLILEAQVRPIIASHLNGHEDSDPEQALQLVDELLNLREAIQFAIEKKSSNLENAEDACSSGSKAETSEEQIGKPAKKHGRNRESQYRLYIILSYLKSTNDSFGAEDFQKQIGKYNLDVKLDTLRTQLSRMCESKLIDRPNTDLYTIASAGEDMLAKLNDTGIGRKVEELRPSGDK